MRYIINKLNVKLVKLLPSEIHYSLICVDSQHILTQTWIYLLHNRSLRFIFGIVIKCKNAKDFSILTKEIIWF